MRAEAYSQIVILHEMYIRQQWPKLRFSTTSYVSVKGLREEMAFQTLKLYVSSRAHEIFTSTYFNPVLGHLTNFQSPSRLLLHNETWIIKPFHSYPL